MAVADKIKSFRTERGWSQARLGQEVGVTRFTIMRWEAGAPIDQKRLPDVKRVMDIPAKEARPDIAEQFAETESAA
jgi:DNA-binding XRE family transcriptional regulator